MELKRLRGLQGIRFGLKSFFCLVSVLCIAIAYVTIQARAVGQLRRHVERLGGTVFFDFEFDKDGILLQRPVHPLPSWLRQLVGDDYLIRPVDIDLSDTPTNTHDVEALMTCACVREIRGLHLDRTEVDDGAIKLISSLSHLESLRIASTNVTNNGVAQLHNLRGLADLDVSYTKIDDGAVESLTKCSSLMFLVMTETQVSKNGVQRIRTSLPKCEVHLDYQFIIP